ncbi:unnamed protein product [Schistosoma mattheei]|uniref:Uncharacterized protein n=1 Tax=Schistosoma mattheei TaxID=31246 RepID=A0A3P8E6Y3_9TREM|nr:unnamed protein product [Schistosoma mattheei]
MQYKFPNLFQISSIIQLLILDQTISDFVLLVEI